MEFESPGGSERGESGPPHRVVPDTPSHVSTMSATPEARRYHADPSGGAGGGSTRFVRTASLGGASSIHRQSFSPSRSMDASAIQRINACLQRSVDYGSGARSAARRTGSRDARPPIKTAEEMRKQRVADLARARDLKAQKTRESIELQRLFRLEARKATGRPVHTTGEPCFPPERASAEQRRKRLSAPQRSASHPRSMQSGAVASPSTEDSFMSDFPDGSLGIDPSEWQRATAAFKDIDGPHLLRQATVDAYFEVPAFMRPLIDRVAPGAPETDRGNTKPQRSDPLDDGRQQRWASDSDVAFRRAQVRF